MREALDGDDLEARSGDGHNRAAGKEDTPSEAGTLTQRDTLEASPGRSAVDNRALPGLGSAG
ncbi:hypothetical protein GCM10028793_61390 [Nocardiopsis oceani]